MCCRRLRVQRGTARIHYQLEAWYWVRAGCREIDRTHDCPDTSPDQQHGFHELQDLPERTHLSLVLASPESDKRIRETLFKMKIHRMVHLRLPDLAAIIADKVRGWIHYYGKFRKTDLYYMFRDLNRRLAKWVRNKYRRFRRKHWYHSYLWLKETAKHYPNLFVHWQHGFTP